MLDDTLPQNNKIIKFKILILIVLISIISQLICLFIILLWDAYNIVIHEQFSKNALAILMFMILTIILLFLQILNQSSRFVQFIAPGMSVTFLFLSICACYDLGLHYRISLENKPFF